MALVSDAGWVDAAIQSMGADRVVADLRRAAVTDPAEPAVAAMLATVLGQAHHLRSSLLLTQPGYVLRQLWMQAAELGEDRLASDLRARLRSQPDSGLIPIWTTRRTSRALSAELGRHDGSVSGGGGVAGWSGGQRRGGPAGAGVGSVPAGERPGRARPPRRLGWWRWRCCRMVGWSAAAATGGCWCGIRPGRRADPVELGRHDSLVEAVAVLPDGRVVSGGADGRVLVWDPSRPGADPVELGRHDGWVDAVAVLPDGRVVSGGHDGRVLVWDPSGRGAVRSSSAATTAR